MRCDNAYLYQTFAGTAFGVSGATPGGFASACATALGGNALNPSASTFTYGSDWANIPTDQLMFLMRQMRRYVVGADGSFDLFGKDWSLEQLLPARRNRHQHQDLQHAAVGCPGCDCWRKTPPPMASSPASTWRRTRCSIRPARSPAATPWPGLWLRAVQSLRWHPDPRPGRLFRRPERSRRQHHWTDLDPDQPPGSLQLLGQWFADRRLGRSGRGRGGLRISRRAFQPACRSVLGR